jgi:hypothetical protein
MRQKQRAAGLFGEGRPVGIPMSIRKSAGSMDLDECFQRGARRHIGRGRLRGKSNGNFQGVIAFKVCCPGAMSIPKVAFAEVGIATLLTRS